MKKHSAFTIVELLIVIVVIGILAAISIVSYTGIQDRAKFTQYKSDLSSLNKAIKLYYAENGYYPISSNWRGDNQTTDDSFIPGLAPEYISKTPQVPPHGAPRPTFLYRSTADGSGYKLIYIQGAAGETLPAVQSTNNPLMDPARNNRAWGYWTDDMSGY